MKQLLIGTTNLAKFNDYQNLLKAYPLEIISLYDYKIKPPAETGKDFEENAVIKARYYFQKTGIPTLADDGGFEIAALNWEPGVKSHRWLGKKSSDEELIKKVFQVLKGVPSNQRFCRMRVVIAVAAPFGIATAESFITGEVALQASEKRIAGYPFRSVMFLPNYGKYFCDLNKKELEILNHRKAAIEKISDIFKELSK